MTANITSPDSSPSLISPNISSQQSVDSLPTTSPVKLGVMASGSGSNFEAIASAIANGQLNAQISVLIYNNPGIKALARAEKYGIPAVLHNHRHTKKREDFDQQIVETLRQYEVEWVVMAGWMRVVTQVLLDAFPNRILNIHPSLLPTFKGVRAVEQALEAGVKITGCTVHVVSLDVDSGPILFQAAVPVLPDDTPETLHARIQVQEHRILVEAIALINC
ncbi:MULTISPECIES: phosphoribosylglycinamide formyltransferase [unclassified Moorena]|uniref:phosphoribosylglycinamide formyltransferase n=1 Tax=unclassified Moorena TaxID=2683338 RepID=UPI0013CCEA1A|nr:MULTISPECIES: phosphoribosylglycinamide formyltransferase [unclassified Moorena]NEO18146.1 phosphoribosylglycinamide formyltransferase [Moorena sp. SIO4A5]NEQ57573.1 phosphoribosylglycinamide formyltransferase [Moorena sp. SIO4A1]